MILYTSNNATLIDTSASPPGRFSPFPPPSPFSRFTHTYSLSFRHDSFTQAHLGRETGCQSNTSPNQHPLSSQQASTSIVEDRHRAGLLFFLCGKRCWNGRIVCNGVDCKNRIRLDLIARKCCSVMADWTQCTWTIKCGARVFRSIPFRGMTWYWVCIALLSTLWSDGSKARLSLLL